MKASWFCNRVRLSACVVAAAACAPPIMGGAVDSLAQQVPSAPVAHGQAQLTIAERAAGWKLLFDGQDTSAWRGYRMKEFPKDAWSIDDGCLKSAGGEGHGSVDLITAEQYGDFELTLEWKAQSAGNSGIIYRVTEKHPASWQTGPEFQILDDAGAGVKPDDPHAAGALYDLYPPAAAKILKPAGEFNIARIRLQNNHLEHWLNGVRVVACDINTDEWTKRIAASKFGAYEGFGVQPKGHIALQHHGDTLWFRNIRIRDLDAPLLDEIKLFDGKSMRGWTHFLSNAGKMEDTWRVQDGVIICKGEPAGYIRTEADYTNYVLKLQWRYDPIAKKGGNSGVLLRLIGPDKVWPKSIEAQLQSGSAGDFWNIDEVQMKTDPARTNGRNTRKLHAAEYPIGEWNEYEIIVDHGDITLIVNGDALNHAWAVAEVPGKIALQSEGGEIHFRNIRLAPIN